MFLLNLWWKSTLERIFNNIKSLGIKYYHKLPIRFKNVVKRGIFLKGNIYYLIFKLKSKFMFHSISNVLIKSINQFEYKIYSQNGEDGIIDMIFQKIDVTNRFCVEFGVGDGCIESNCLYLIKHKKWKYLFMDASDNLPSFVKKEFITAENINLLFKSIEFLKNLTCCLWI